MAGAGTGRVGCLSPCAAGGAGSPAGRPPPRTQGGSRSLFVSWHVRLQRLLTLGSNASSGESLLWHSERSRISCSHTLGCMHPHSHPHSPTLHHMHAYSHTHIYTHMLTHTCVVERVFNTRKSKSSWEGQGTALLTARVTHTTRPQAPDPHSWPGLGRSQGLGCPMSWFITELLNVYKSRWTVMGPAHPAPSAEGLAHLLLHDNLLCQVTAN